MSILKRVILFCVFIVVITVGTDRVKLYVTLLNDQQELGQARELWRNNKPLAYQVRVRGYSFVEESDPCHYLDSGYVMMVRNNEVTDSDVPLECQAIYKQLTPEKIFDQIEHDLKNADLNLTVRPILKIDATYGFVSDYYFSYADSMSSSSPSEWHTKRIVFENFTALEMQSSP